jgi:hypothetical protein
MKEYSGSWKKATAWWWFKYDDEWYWPLEKYEWRNVAVWCWDEASWDITQDYRKCHPYA